MCHMAHIFALLEIHRSPVDSPQNEPVTLNVDIPLVVSLNKRLNKHLIDW